MSDQAKKLRDILQKSLVSSPTETVQTKSVKIYAISSGKGGVGKTNVVLNTAIEIQRKGKKVLIVDTDFGFANIDVLCGLTPHYSLQDVLFGDKKLDEIMINGPEGIKIIPGGNQMLELKSLSPQQQKNLEEQFMNLADIDIILIDTGAGITKSLMMYVMFAQELLLVITPEPTSLTDAYSFLKVIDQYQLKKKAGIIINKVESTEEAKRTYQVIQETVGHYLTLSTHYCGCINDDKHVSISVKKQTPFVVLYPTTKASKDIKELAHYLTGFSDQKREVKTIKEVFNRLIRVFT